MHQKASPFPSSVPVIHPQGKPLSEWVVQTLKEYSTEYDVVIVDTFPQGIAHEITQDVLQCYVSSFLVARYLREEVYHNYAEACSWYTRMWIPYQSQNCEWNRPPDGDYMGTIVRSIVINDEQTDLCVIGNHDLIPKRWLSLFPEHTVFIHYRFHELPHAQKYLCVGAGYNLFWELYFLDRIVAHIPIEKKYDDQFRRCMRFGRMVATYQELFDFLGDGL